MDYQNGKIYKIVDLATNETYYGSTTQSLAKRLGAHKEKYNAHINDRSKKYYTSFEIIKNNNYNIYLCENHPCTSREELRRKEGEYILNNECVNKRVAGRTCKENYLAKHEYYLDKAKEYREANGDIINEKQRQNYSENKEQYANKAKNYRQQNKAIISERRSQRIICECGKDVNKDHLSRHKKTTEHLQLLNQI